MGLLVNLSVDLAVVTTLFFGFSFCKLPNLARNKILALFNTWF